MKSGDRLKVQAVDVVLWDRAPHSIAGPLYDPWWVIREGPQKQELWLIGRRRRNGRLSAWTFAGQFNWRDGLRRS